MATSAARRLAAKGHLVHVAEAVAEMQPRVLSAISSWLPSPPPQQAPPPQRAAGASPRRHSRRASLGLAAGVFTRDFSVGRSIGEGSFGTVFEATSLRDGAVKAVKTVRSEELRRNEIVSVRKVHAEARRRGDAPLTNVMNLDTVYREGEQTHIVSDKYEGGDLLDFMLDMKGGLPEDHAARLSRQVLRSVAEVHRAGVAHLDVKPENLLFRHSRPAATASDPVAMTRGIEANELVLVDFGSSQSMPDDEPQAGMPEGTGTEAYMAPELFEQRASKASDLWSAGVVSYVLLTGQMPFRKTKDPRSQRRLIREGEFLRSARYTQLSPGARSFVEKLLCTEASARMTMDEALSHEFVARP